MVETDSDHDATTTDDTPIEQEPIVTVFRNPANVRFLTVLSDGGGESDMPAADIAEQAGTSRNAWYENKERLIDLGLVSVTRTAGNTPLYAANTESEAFQAFTHLRDALIDADDAAAAE